MRVVILLLAALALLAAADPPAARKNPAPNPGARPRLQSAGMRNENVAVNRIDNNAIKEANVRVGANPTAVTEFRPDASYYATEFGRPASASLVLAPATDPAGWHAELFESHQNSVFNARTFFQSGPVRPSRRNHYGARVTGALNDSTWLTFNGSQRKIRGMVNGNVLVPLADERTPRATNPQVRALITRWLAAYPNELPNRPDFDIRALNTNAPQRIDEVDPSARLDHNFGPRGRLSLFHQLTRQRVDAFQLVAGQNPDNDIHTHRTQLSWRAALSPATDLAAGFTFNRAKTVLLPEPNAVGVRVRMGYQIEELGPDSEFPVNRAANSFRYGALFSHRRSGHTLTWGADLTRSQLNGIETYNSLGYFSFANAYGRTAIENFLMGTPAFYETNIGELARGFRNWTVNAFFGDAWQANARLQISYGLRFNAVTAPTEVNHLHTQPYASDLNNFSPRLGLALRLPRAWILRAASTISFSDIPPVTYQQIRFNLPYVRYLQVQNPDLLNPLHGLDLTSASARTTPVIFAPNLVSPYSHQYNLSLERKLGAAQLRLGYLGSRSLKSLNSFITNRADPVPGIPLTLDTVDQRRADPRYFDVRQVVNGGSAWFNAGQASLDLPVAAGLRGSLVYTFSKAIDEGADYTATAANRDLSRGRAQWQYEAFRDRRGLSNFDSPHSLLVNYSYDLPRLASRHRLVRLFADDWQIAGVALAKSGTPLTLYVGSDAPGYGNVDGGPSDRPHIVDPSILGSTIAHPDTAPLILRRDRFAFIQPGEPRGSIGRGTFRKARIANWNVALTKQWVAVASREWRIQLRTEVYNLTNTPQFDEPQRNLTSPSFGKITNALNDGRVFQIGLRLAL